MSKFVRNNGFTLVEIMIVVAIVVLLASLAIPNFLRARISANEAGAISSLRVISTAMESFRSAQTPPVYPSALIQLSGATPPYIDTQLSGGTKKGYNFVLSDINGGITYTCTASPISTGSSGVREFIVDQSGVITSGGTAIE